MLKNFIKLTLRNMIKFKVFSVINILGLAVGITCFIALSLFIIDETGYDGFYKNADQIYRVCVHTSINGKESNNSKSAGPTGSVLKKDFPEVINYTRIGYIGVQDLKYLDKNFREGNVYTADSTFFEIFGLPFIYGNPKSALKNPNSIVVAETAAKRYFGNENPVGKVLTTGSNKTYLVTGLMKDFPKNSSFSCEFLISMATDSISRENRWLNLWYSTFVVLKKGTDTRDFENKMKGTVHDYIAPQAEAFLGVPIKDFLAKGNDYSLFLQPLKSIYLYSQRDYGIDLNTEWSAIKTSDIAYTYIFASIAAFLLLIAIINFMNLATARSERRAKEVGIRKTLGSDRFMLVFQFISESVITCFLSVVISVGLSKLILPVFNSFVGKNLSLDLFDNYYTIPLLFLFTLIVGILAGSYPAFYLSSFQAGHILKPGTGKKNSKHSLRSILVIIQFAISIMLIIGTLTIKNQLVYIQNKNLGFNKEELLSINNAALLGSRTEAFKTEILKNLSVLDATNSSNMFRAGIPGNGYLFDKRANTDPVLGQFLNVDYDFLKTFQIKIKKGRFFSRDFSSDSDGVIINETAVREFGAKDNPIGKNLYKLNDDLTISRQKIIGVVEDFNYESLHQRVRPLALNLSSDRPASKVLTIRIMPDNIRATINSIKETWFRFSGKENMNYSFLDQQLERLYESEEKTARITALFSSIAIFIACLGLFGLAAFVTEQRTKEIGIRKVVGASVFEIVALLSRDFTKWVILANVIAWPVSYYIMRNWLQNFAYRTDVGLSSFLLSGLIALAVALVTVSYQTVRAALTNPIESLR